MPFLSILVVQIGTMKCFYCPQKDASVVHWDSLSRNDQIFLRDTLMLVRGQFVTCVFASCSDPSKSGDLESQRPQQVGRTKRPNHRNPTNGFNARIHRFLHFCHLSSGGKWFSLHKQSLLEEDECTQASTDSVAKDVAAPDTTRGPEGTCSPESTDWGADDEVLEEWRLKNTLGRAERTHKSQTDQHQGVPQKKIIAGQ